MSSEPADRSPADSKPEQRGHWHATAEFAFAAIECIGWCLAGVVRLFALLLAAITSSCS